VGSHLQNYDFVVVLSHFKGHTMGGFGGAIKNMSIGIASKSGKNLIALGTQMVIMRLVVSILGGCNSNNSSLDGFRYE